MFDFSRLRLRAPADEGTPGAAVDDAEAGEAAADEGQESPGSLLDKDSSAKDGDSAGEGTEAAEPLTMESITLPEGAEVDEGAMTDFLSLMNDTEISAAERAQKLIDLQFTIAEEAAKASQALWNKTQVDWQAEARALPEIGGDNLEKTLASIKAGLDKLGATDETYAALNFTGAGNHPEVIRILHKATAHLVEGQPPATPGSPAKGKLSQADRMYGNSNME
ncbi:MAG: hypothetical protein OEY86_20960 [Nitrospira sp.]|nr:hypothetical protein [Nitrospira sp.]